MEDAEVPVKGVPVDGAALFGLGLGDVRHGGQRNVEKGLDFWGWRADVYYNILQLRLGDPKGLPCFFVLGGFCATGSRRRAGLGRPLLRVRGEAGEERLWAKG